jgi:hypothetical protein
MVNTRYAIKKTRKEKRQNPLKQSEKIISPFSFQLIITKIIAHVIIKMKIAHKNDFPQIARIRK